MLPFNIGVTMTHLFDSLLEPEKSYERTATFPRLTTDLLDGVSVRELDIELDTVPAELLDLIERR